MIKRFDGSNYIDVENLRRFNGANWLDTDINMRFDGSNWVEFLDRELVFRERKYYSYYNSITLTGDSSCNFVMQGVGDSGGGGCPVLMFVCDEIDMHIGDVAGAYMTSSFSQVFDQNGFVRNGGAKYMAWSTNGPYAENYGNATFYNRAVDLQLDTLRTFTYNYQYNTDVYNRKNFCLCIGQYGSIWHDSEVRGSFGVSHVVVNGKKYKAKFVLA